MKMRKTIRISRGLLDLTRPAVMGIINATPDSFYSGSRIPDTEAAARCGEMLRAGAAIIDVGGCSTRPGAPVPSAAEELERLAPVLSRIREQYPDAILSVDTFRASVAHECVVRWNADIINDISGGDLDPDMWDAVAELGVPYVLMHTRGTPDTMQSLAVYDDVAAEVLRDMAEKVDALHAKGVADVIVDPGFGFAKNVDQNYRLLASLGAFSSLGCPLLAGMSRKTMVWKELGITPEQSLPGTVALNTIALLNGADILRVHDVEEAVQAVGVAEAYLRNVPERNTILTLGHDRDSADMSLV